VSLSGRVPIRLSNATWVISVVAASRNLLLTHDSRLLNACSRLSHTLIVTVLWQIWARFEIVSKRSWYYFELSNIDNISRIKLTCFMSVTQDGVAEFSTRGGFRSAGAAGGGEAIKCFRCNGLNHYARDCLAPAPASSPATAVTTTKACYNCGKIGHVRFSL